MQFTIYRVGSFVNQTLLSFPECDNCAQTLLNDLEKLEDEMGRIKAQLDNASASASSQDRLKKLEKAVSDTKVTFQCTVTLPADSEGYRGTPAEFQIMCRHNSQDRLHMMS